MSTSPRMTSPITLKVGLLALGGIALVGLIVLNMHDSIFGTPLTIRSVPDGSTTTSMFFPIEGTARHARELRINGRPVTMNRDGSFKDEVVLSPGYNIVEVALRDQFDNQKVKTYHVVLNPTATVAVNPDTHYQ